jgi:hypothetical protein
MTEQETTGRELVRFEVADKDGRMVQAAVPAELAERYPTLGAADELAELVAEVFEGQDGRLSITDMVRITVPDGKSVAFTVGEDAEKTVRGIVLVHQPRRKYWVKALEDSGGGERPDCKSLDGITGIGMYGLGSEENPTGSCADCPMAQWHKDADGKNIATPCKQEEVLLLLVGDSALPYVVTVPPTSLTALRNYWKRELFAKSMVSLVEVETEIGLTKAENAAGLVYNQLTFRKLNVITKGMDKAEKAQYKIGLLGLAAQFGEILKQVDDADDARPATARSGDPDDEGGYSMTPPPPVDDDIEAYANVGAHE